MKLERRTEGASDRDHDSEPRESSSPSDQMRLEIPDDPLRGMSDGEVLQRLELI
jgi:hypothetical protein